MESLSAGAKLIADARSIAVLTGAGISAESGIPTFRDALTGLWANFRAEELATPEAFLANPELVWDWYAWRRWKVAEAAPNPGHLALVDIERAACARGAGFTLITQNVDGLHALAGSREVLELHGNIRRVKCFDHHHPAAVIPQDGPRPPHCAACGSMLRPDVVWFGEPLPAEVLDRAIAAASACEVFLSIGTSTVVEPAASLPGMARAAGATVIEVNPAPTPFTPLAHLAFAGSAGRVLPALAGT